MRRTLRDARDDINIHNGKDVSTVLLCDVSFDFGKFENKCGY